MYLEDLQTNKRNVDDKLKNRTRRLKRETYYQGICGSQINKYKKVEDTQKDEGKEMYKIQTNECRTFRHTNDKKCKIDGKKYKRYRHRKGEMNNNCGQFCVGVRRRFFPLERKKKEERRKKKEERRKKKEERRKKKEERNIEIRRKEQKKNRRRKIEEEHFANNK